MVGIVQGVIVDGKTYVSLEDYQQLMKKYEDAVGTESNEQIIARVGEDEIPDDEPDGCKGCGYEYETEDGMHCKKCIKNAVDNYKPANRLDKIRGLTDEELADFIEEVASGHFRLNGIKDIKKWLCEQGEIFKY